MIIRILCPSVCHVAVAGDVFRWVPAVWDLLPRVGLGPNWSRCVTDGRYW
jgi:hypothetical protein